MAKKLSELYKPKAEMGRAFVDANKPPPALKKSKPTENDGQFSATNVKTFKRAVNRMGYDVGADEVENKGGVGVNDSPKETGIAPYTVKMGEEIEQLDELSPKTLKSYVKKAGGYGPRSAWGLAQKGEKEEDKSMSTDGNKYPAKQERHQKAANKLYRKSNNREKGVDTAKFQLLARHRMTVKEDIMEAFNFDQEDTLSEDEVIDTLFEMLETMLEGDKMVYKKNLDPNTPKVPGITYYTTPDGPPKYNKDAVNKSIESSNRAGRKIGKKEAKAIHALLKGRH